MGRVVVVGGGISGLAAAWELSGGADVVVMEAAPRLGGALDSAKFGGRIVDTGPDGFLGRRPEALDLCHEIGLGEALVPIAGRGAGVWARGRVRDRFPPAWPWAYRPGSGPPPVQASSACAASSDWRGTHCSPVPTYEAPSATAPSARWWRASSANGWRTAWWTPS